ncbi:MAG: acyltransferase domain-containing protein, partial [Ardenticatenales bacterium]|nr:acyltransferase domain-containing protein [Ardenticatenales bacterium]
MSDHPISDTDIAIIGMAGRYPKAPTLAEFWRKLCAGEEFTTFYSEEELRALGIPEEAIQDPHYIRAGGQVETIEEFDAAFFGYNPREATFMDPQQRHFLECAWEAMEDAGYDSSRIEGSVGVFGGSAMDTYIVLNIASNPHLMTPANQLTIQVGNDNSYLTTRVSYKLNLHGPSHTIQSACSTSLVATHVACQSLLNWECDMALVGGVAIHVMNRYGYWHMEGGMHSPDGHCRTFDAKGGGPVFNMGVGAVVLKRLAEAMEDGDNIYAVIKGSAINNDGSLKVSYAAPSVGGQARVIAEALANANIEPETISFVEAHGTATPLGDPIEVEALTKAYRAQTDKKQFCGIGSVKSNLGHLDAAAGVTSLIKASLMLQHKVIPPSLHFERGNPQIDFANSPFSVATSLSEWERGEESPRRAGVSSFGIGGTNAHAILEEAPPMEPSSEARPAQLLVLSARTETALVRAASNLKEHLQQHTELDLADVAYTLQVGRKAFNHRRAIVCRDTGEALAALNGDDPQRGVTGAYNGEERPVVFMFSGQGAQYPQMIREWYGAEPAFQSIVDECCDLLKPHLGVDLRDLLLAGDDEATTVAEQLNQTQITQSALFVTEYGLARLWMDWGIKPRAMIGHSIGEYVAACLAGVFSLEDALSLVAARGKLMQSLPTGVMLTVPLSESELKPLLGQELSIAAVNEEARCVVSGPESAIQTLEAQLEGRGLAGRRLHTSHAFHSAMMEPMLTPFTEQVRRIERHAPSIPFISNVTGSWISEEQAIDPSYWATHLRQAVRFADGVGELLRDPNMIFLEVGPGNTLATLTRRHPTRNDSHLLFTSLHHPQEQTSNLEHLLTTLGRLWVAGVEIDWQKFHDNEWRHRVSLPTYPFERQRYWIEPSTLASHTTIEEESAIPGKKADVADWFYLPSWQRTLPPVRATRSEQPKPWLLFLDEVGLASKLAERLRASGESVFTVTAGEGFTRPSAQHFTLKPQVASEYDLLLETLVAEGHAAGTLVHAWNVTGDAPLSNDNEARVVASFYSLLYLAQALGRQATWGEATLRILSDNMQAVSGEPVLYPLKALLLGPCKVIPLEYDPLTCQSIDLRLPASGSWQEGHLLTHLLAEMSSEVQEPLVAYRGAHRWVPHYEAAPIPEVGNTPLPLRTGGVYLITGGLGGIGYELARYLARTVQARLILTSRSAASRDTLPERQALEALGATEV